MAVGPILPSSAASRRAATEHLVIAALDEATLLRGQARAAPVGDLSRWPAALSAANKAKALLLADESDPGLRRRVDQLAATLEQEQADAAHQAAEADRDRKFIERLNRIRLTRFEQGEKWEPASSDAEYATAFREFGIDVDTLDPMESSRRLKARSDPLELAFFLDDWAQVRRDASHEESGRAQDQSWHRLIAAAMATDPDAWRNSIRGLVGGNDLAAVQRLANDEKALYTQPARSLLLLAQVLEAHRNNAHAERVLRRAWRLRPDDFWICSQLSRLSEKERVRFATAAVALRPENGWTHAALAEAVLFANSAHPFNEDRGWQVMWVNLLRESEQDWDFIKHLPSELKDNIRQFTFISVKTAKGSEFTVVNTVPYRLEFPEEVTEEYKEAIRLSPRDASLHANAARVLVHKNGGMDEALKEFLEARRLDPSAGTLELAIHLFLNGRLDQAIPHIREVIRGAPNQPGLHVFLGSVLRKKGDLDAAFAEFRQAFLLTDDSRGTEELDLKVIAGFLRATGKREDEIEAFRERIRKHPEGVYAVTHLANLFRSQGNFAAEGDVYREAIRLNPKVPRVHGLLARFLWQQGKSDEARAEFDREIVLLREQVKSAPNDPDGHQALGKALAYQGKRDEAIAAFREAGHVDPNKRLRYVQIARLLASSPDAKLRDGKAAVAFATKACELTEWKNAYDLDTLAAAHAEAGDFDSAVRRQTEGISLLSDVKQKEDFGERLKLYRDRKPFRDSK